jgi:hypothetical protein
MPPSADGTAADRRPYRRDTASHKYSPAVMLHKAGSHDCRPYAWASAVPFNDQALRSADQLPIQLPLQ